MVKTNDVPGETSYEVKDNFGNIIYSRNNMDANTLYKDTMTFEPGCYSLQLLDTGEIKTLMKMAYHGGRIMMEMVMLD